MIAMYLEDESGEYKLSSSKEFPKEGYVLNLEKSTCTNGGVLSQDSETKQISLRTSNSTKCDLYFEKEKIITIAYGLKSNCPSITNYTDGDTKEMYVFAHPATEQTEALTDYRYIGANPNNWIRFNDEDWRIIGVFTVETESGEKKQLIKIIRNESIGDLAWDSNIANEWSTATLKSLLNGDYYNRSGDYVSKGLNTTTQSQIENVKWYLGGSNTQENLGGPDYYAFERGTTVYSGRSTNIIQKVGLMYPSDYVYTYANGVDEKCYTTMNNCRTDQGGTPSAGWLYSSSEQWTQAPYASYSNSAFYVSTYGFVFGNNDVRNTYGVRPAVFLTSDIKITGGDGSQENAYTIELN